MSILLTGQKGGRPVQVDTWPLTGLQKTTNVLTDAFNNSWKAPIEFVNGQIQFNSEIGMTESASHPAALLENGPRALPSDRQIFDGSFIRLKNLYLAYDLPLKKGNQLNFLHQDKT